MTTDNGQPRYEVRGSQLYDTTESRPMSIFEAGEILNAHEALLVKGNPWLDDFEVVTAAYVTKLESQLSVLQERLRETEAERDRWKDAVLDGHVINFTLKKEHDTDPRKAVEDLIRVEIEMELDPAISQRAADVKAAFDAEKSRADTAESKLTTANARNLDLQAQVVARIQERDTAERALEAYDAAATGVITTSNKLNDPWPVDFWRAFHRLNDIQDEYAELLDRIASARQPAAGQDSANEGA